jgi:hypothetical protein
VPQKKKKKKKKKKKNICIIVHSKLPNYSASGKASHPRRL